MPVPTRLSAARGRQWPAFAAAWLCFALSATLAQAEEGTPADEPCGKDAVQAELASIANTHGQNVTEITLKFGRLDVPAENVEPARQAFDALASRCPGNRRIEDWRFHFAKENETLPDAWVVEAVDAYLDSRPTEQKGPRPPRSGRLPAAQVLVDRGLQLERVLELVKAERAVPVDPAAFDSLPEMFRGRMKAASERSRVDLSLVASRAHLGLGRTDAAQAEARTASEAFGVLVPEEHGKSLLSLHERLSDVRAAVDLPAIDAPEVADSEPAIPGFGDVSEPLPALLDYDDIVGRGWTVADFQGQATVINVWATWCVPCLVELEEAQKLHDELASVDGLQVVTFNVDKDPEKVAPFVAKRGWTFPVVLATDVLEGKPSGLPQTWRVDSEAVVRHKALGFGEHDIGKWPGMQREALETLRRR